MTVTYAMMGGHWEEPDLSAEGLAALRTLANAATPGPWRRTGTDVWAWVEAGKIRYHVIFAGRAGDEAGAKVGPQNFIVACRAMVAPMIDEIEKLRQVVAIHERRVAANYHAPPDGS